MNRNKYKITIISFLLLSIGLIYMESEKLNFKSDLPSKLFAGQIHYSRIPVQYWEHRLLMLKSMGLNSLSVYIMWNYHQISKGKFDYQTGNKNLTLFLQLAHKHNMKVLIRPGPYVCAEWDFGGFPARLLSIEGIKLRANNQPYLNQVKIYFESLVPILKPFLISNGGPIILLQIQNEYGFYGNDKSYMEALKQMWRNLDFNCDQYYVDWVDNVLKCHWVGANIGLNNGVTQEQWNYVRQFQPQGYILGGEIYSGWLTHWGQKWQGKSMDEFLKQYNFLLSNNHSFSMYMAHGGSNFGLTAGANSFNGKLYDYGGHVTSYDYDAPINEQGAPTQKFYKFKELTKKYADWQIPEPPKPISMISIPNFIPSGFADLLQNLPEPTLKNEGSLVAFEDNKLQMWNQGFVLYQTHISQGKHNLTIQVNDFGLIFLNGQHIKTIDRGQSTKTKIQINANLKENTLRILVEAMGHINFDHAMETDKKGLISFESENKTKFTWNVYKIPINQDIFKWTKKSIKSIYPRLYQYNLTLKEVGDTYLNMERWVKGYLFVNGINLGRYWSKGPQQKVFCPGVWLKEGINSIIVLELLSGQSKFIKGQTTLNAGQQIVFKYHSSDFVPVKPKLKIQ